MLDPERKFKYNGKVTLDSFASEILLCQQLFAFKETWMEMRLPSFFKTTNVTKFFFFSFFIVDEVFT